MKWKLLIFILLFFVSSVHAQPNWRKWNNKSFKEGEKLLYEIRWGPVSAGFATLTIPEKVWMNNRQVYHLVSETYSNSFFDSFFKVRDKNESWLDVEGLFSYGYEKNLSEGNYRKTEKVVYDQEKGVARMQGKTEFIPIPCYVQDILSSLYFFRTFNLEINKPFSIDVHSNDKVYSLEVKVYRKEKVTVTAGTFDCYFVEPILKSEGLFKHKGRLLIWLTTDDKHVPVLLKTQIALGFLDAELIEMTLPCKKGEKQN